MGAKYLVLAALVGCTPMASQETARLAPEAQPVGLPEDCIDTSSIRATQVPNDQTIDFHMRNGAVFRNTLTNHCPGLSAQGFAYRSTHSRLCSIDTITVVEARGVPGPVCGLSTFQQVELTRG